jgi:hypothetical protein
MNLVTEFNITGNCVIDVEATTNAWQSNRFFIADWKGKKYTLCKRDLRSKGCFLLKVTISVNQAKELINNLGLVEVQSIFASGTNWYTPFQAQKIEVLLTELDKTLAEEGR